MLKEFQALLHYGALPPTRLIQLMAINMFAIENTALKGKKKYNIYKPYIRLSMARLIFYFNNKSFLYLMKKTFFV